MNARDYVGNADPHLTPEDLRRIEEAVRERYASFSSGLPFHGWHHVEFVRVRALRLAQKNSSNHLLVEAAALLHDLNYMVKRNSRVEAGKDLRHAMLERIGIGNDMILRIECVIAEAETEFRDDRISLEAQALADADTLYKALPITPVMLSHRYMEETGESLRQLCDRIIRDQVRLRDAGIYFYDSETRAEYERWTDANLHLWQCINESLGFKEIQALVAELEGASEDRI